jgi:hypothetical protein
MHWDPSSLSILRTIFGMGLLTFVMGSWMAAVRNFAMRRAGITLQEAAHTRDLAARLPSSAQRVADNYNHLFEAPTIFYAVALAIIIAGIADPIYAACAWIFLGLRVMHSLVQATINRVQFRAALFGLSWVPLAVMIVRPIITL